MKNEKLQRHDLRSLRPQGGIKIKKSLVKIPIEKQRLSATLFIPGGNTKSYPGVVFYHGRGSNQRGYIPRAEKLAEKGMAVLTLDFRGCGRSPERIEQQTIKKGIEDALAAYDFFSTQSVVDKNRVGICGSSYGGYLASIITSNRAVKSLALRAPAVYKDEWINTPLVAIISQKGEAFRNPKLTAQENIAFSSLLNFKGSLLIIESEKDEVIPHQIIEGYWKHTKNIANRRMAILKEASHNLLPGSSPDQQFIKLLIDWFTETL